MDTLGQRLQTLRKEHFSMNQSAFSQVLGISQGALSEIERDNRGLPIEALTKLTIYSKWNNPFSCEWLLTGEGGMSSDPAPDPRNLTGYQRLAAEACLENLTMDQAALINSYEKLDDNGKEEIWALIKVKLKRVPGLGSNFQTSKNEAG